MHFTCNGVFLIQWYWYLGKGSDSYFHHCTLDSHHRADRDRRQFILMGNLESPSNWSTQRKPMEKEQPANFTEKGLTQNQCGKNIWFVHTQKRPESFRFWSLQLQQILSPCPAVLLSYSILQQRDVWCSLTVYRPHPETSLNINFRRHRVPAAAAAAVA